MTEKIKELLAKQLRIAVETIGDDSNIVDDLKADSLDMIEMLMAIEENYGVTVPDEEISKFKTVRDVAEYVESRIDK